MHEEFVKIAPCLENILTTKNKENLIDIIEYLKNIREKLLHFIKKYERISR
jgi:hypothetical protein